MGEDYNGNQGLGEIGQRGATENHKHPLRKARSPIRSDRGSRQGITQVMVGFRNGEMESSPL